MTLETPPSVYINGSWYTTEWDTTSSLDIATNDTKSMTVRDVQYWKWTISVDNEPAQVYRLLVAGADATAKPPGTVTVPVGSYRTRTLVVDTPERIEKASGTFTVTA